MTFYTRMNNPRIHRFYRPPYRYAHTHTRAHTRIYIYFHFIRRSPIIIDSKFMPLNDLQTSIRMQRDTFETRASWLKKIQFVTIRVFFFLLLLFFFFFPSLQFISLASLVHRIDSCDISRDVSIADHVITFVKRIVILVLNKIYRNDT